MRGRQSSHPTLNDCSRPCVADPFRAGGSGPAVAPAPAEARPHGGPGGPAGTVAPGGPHPVRVRAVAPGPVPQPGADVDPAVSTVVRYLSRPVHLDPRTRDEPHGAL